MKLDIDITLNKWGLFEPFDGENFNDNLKYLFSRERQKSYDWYITTKKISSKEYIIYYIPTERSLKYDSDQKVEKYYVTEDLIKEKLKQNPKFGIWEINTNIDVIEIDDFIWYYLGLGAECGILTTIDLNRSQKRMEVDKLIKKYSE